MYTALFLQPCCPSASVVQLWLLQPSLQLRINGLIGLRVCTWAFLRSIGISSASFMYRQRGRGCAEAGCENCQEGQRSRQVQFSTQSPKARRHSNRRNMTFFAIGMH